MALLSVGEPLPDKNRDHDLSGGFSLSAKVPVPGHGTCVHGDDVCCKLNTIILGSVKKFVSLEENDSFLVRITI